MFHLCDFKVLERAAIFFLTQIVGPKVQVGCLVLGIVFESFLEFLDAGRLLAGTKVADGKIVVKGSNSWVQGDGFQVRLLGLLETPFEVERHPEEVVAQGITRAVPGCLKQKSTRLRWLLLAKKLLAITQ